MERQVGLQRGTWTDHGERDRHEAETQTQNRRRDRERHRQTDREAQAQDRQRQRKTERLKETQRHRQSFGQKGDGETDRQRQKETERDSQRVDFRRAVTDGLSCLPIYTRRRETGGRKSEPEKRDREAKTNRRKRAETDLYDRQTTTANLLVRDGMHGIISN